MAAKRESRQEWARRVAAWRRSGETAKVFASRHGWNASSLHWWSSQGRRVPSEGVPFVEMTSTLGASASHVVDVVLRNGRRFRVRGSIEPEMLATLARALEA
jgi:hypothetical protein